MPEGESFGSEEYGYAEYGLVLRNRSSSRDAIDVTIEVEAVDARGESVTEDYALVTLIPAGANFVISGALIWRGSLEVAGLETDVHVGQTAPRGRRLPLVKRVAVSSSGRVTGSLTNPYKKPLPGSAAIYGVGFDSRGKIVSVGYDVTDAITRPGATVAFDMRGSSSAMQGGLVTTSARVSVDPCGYFAFTRDCPVPGAQS